MPAVVVLRRVRRARVCVSALVPRARPDQVDRCGGGHPHRRRQQQHRPRRGLQSTRQGSAGRPQQRSVRYPLTLVFSGDVPCSDAERLLLLDGRCSARSTRSRKRGRDSESSTGAPAAKAAKTKKQSAAAAAKAKAKAEEEAAAAQAGVRAAFPSSPCHDAIAVLVSASDGGSDTLVPRGVRWWGRAAARSWGAARALLSWLASTIRRRTHSR